MISDKKGCPYGCCRQNQSIFELFHSTILENVILNLSKSLSWPLKPEECFQTTKQLCKLLLRVTEVQSSVRHFKDSLVAKISRKYLHHRSLETKHQTSDFAISVLDVLLHLLINISTIQRTIQRRSQMCWCISRLSARCCSQEMEIN